MTGERVGSLTEETAKLMAVLQAWGSGHATPAPSAGVDEPAGPAPECRDCPVCRVRRAVADVPPEVRAHFASAGASLALGVHGLLSGLNAASRRNASHSTASSRESPPPAGNSRPPGADSGGSASVDAAED